jgi:transcriptional regulator with XRE-family HTH domain
MRDQENITPIDQYIIDFIRDLRTKKNLSQQGLADILQVSKSYISSIESTNSRAKYNLKYINIIADHFEMSPREFLPLKPAPLEFQHKEKAASHKSTKKKTVKKERTKK